MTTFKNEKLQEHFRNHCYYLEYSYYFVYICRLRELKMELEIEEEHGF